MFRLLTAALLLTATSASAENALDVALRQNAGVYRDGDRMLTSAVADRSAPQPVIVEPVAMVELRAQLAAEYAKRVIAEHDHKLMYQPLFIQLNNLKLRQTPPAPPPKRWSATRGSLCWQGVRADGRCE